MTRKPLVLFFLHTLHRQQVKSTAHLVILIQQPFTLVNTKSSPIACCKQEQNPGCIYQRVKPCLFLPCVNINSQPQQLLSANVSTEIRSQKKNCESLYEDIHSAADAHEEAHSQSKSKFKLLQTTTVKIIVFSSKSWLLFLQNYCEIKTMHLYQTYSIKTVCTYCCDIKEITFCLTLKHLIYAFYKPYKKAIVFQLFFSICLYSSFSNSKDFTLFFDIHGIRLYLNAMHKM